MYKLKSSSSYIETLNILDNNEKQKLQRKLEVIKNYRTLPKKTRTKIYGRTDSDRRDEADTTTPVVGK